MAFARYEKNGQVAFTEGSRVLKVPAEEACRERLIKLLEAAGGDIEHQDIAAFWKDRARDVGSSDELVAAWANETFERLNKVWQELTKPPDQPGDQQSDDVFSAFGFGE